MNDEHMNELRNAILNDNKMLYCMKNRPWNETCMCWKLECGDGWLHVINEMSKSLEALNYIYYPKFRVRIQMDQLKSKFATLHAYYSVIADPPKWMCMWHNVFQKLFDKVSQLNFKKVSVLDRDAYDEVVEKELATREEFEKEKKDCAYCENVEVFEKDGKFIRKATYHHYKQTHPEATKHKLLYKLLCRRHVIENFPSQLFNFTPSHKQQCIIELIEEKAKAIVSKAEKACECVCEKCGHYISDESKYSPRCTTRGWITYLCPKCADESGQEYIMNGSVWKDGKEIMTKKQYAEEKAKIAERFKVAQEDDDLEEIDDEN